ncbi:MAG: hypothetical protein ABI467_13050 [Kofleriaceae bacterium]
MLELDETGIAAAIQLKAIEIDLIRSTHIQRPNANCASCSSGFRKFLRYGGVIAGC